MWGERCGGPLGSDFEGLLCPIGELGLYPCSVGSARGFKQVALMFSSALLTNMSQGSQAKVRTQQGLNKY